MNHELYHYATGGTIDSHWNAAKDTAVPNEESIVPRYLANLRLPHHCVSSEKLFLKDSRDIAPQDQSYIAARVGESGHKRIVVTTGTYLMSDIAMTIGLSPTAQHFDRIDKTCVVTGARIPIKGHLMSDGGFNLGMSAAVLQEKNVPRVMLVMNGMCFDVAKGVRKDLTEAAFSSHDGKDVLNYDRFDLITIGGSIDFVHDGLDNLVPADESAIPSYLRDHVRIKRPFDALNPFVKDSRQLDKSDKDLILDSIRVSNAERILLTLGIYKMKDIQDFLKENLSGSDRDKKVVLTGSTVPLRISEMTDASFNLGFALGKIGFLQNGVHIALNGTMMEDGDNISV